MVGVVGSKVQPRDRPDPTGAPAEMDVMPMQYSKLLCIRNRNLPRTNGHLLIDSLSHRVALTYDQMQP